MAAASKIEHPATLGRVLVVEDDDLLAITIGDTLRHSGSHVWGPVASVEAALVVIESAELDAALLDWSLAETDASAVADALTAKDIPLVFMSGHSLDVFPEKYRDCHILIKPFRHKVLRQALKDAMSNKLLLAKQNSSPGAGPPDTHE
jgi:DNA-binding NtrC family response regulator